MDTLRVMQAMAGAPRGGAELFFERLVMALHRAGVQQHVLIRKDEVRKAKLSAGGLRPVELAFGGRFDLLTRPLFKREIKRFRPHLVLTWMNRATRFCPKGDFVHLARLGGYYDLKYYENCDYLICNTEDLVEYVVKQGWPAEKAHYLPNFVDERTAPPVSRRDFHTPETLPLLFTLGRLHENKGFDTLLHAMSRISDVYLWIAGDGPDRERLETLAKELGVKPRVRFLGWRDDGPALHAAADMFVCPSRHEPLGNVVIEAWAQRSPVVATASQGPAKLIENGENGLLVPVEDPVALAEAIRGALRDREMLARVAEAGRRSYEQRFTEEIVVEQYKAFFEKVSGACAALQD